MKNVRFIEMYFILLCYVFINIFLPNILQNSFYLIVNSLFYVICFIYLYFKTNNNHGRFPKNKEYIKKMIIIMLSYVFVYVFLGLIFGFVKSPYSHKIPIFIKNCFQILLPIVCIEYIRSALVNYNKNNGLIIILTTIIFFLLEFDYNMIIKNILNYSFLFQYFSSTVLPLIFSEILYCYLTANGSYKLVLSYRIIFELIILVLPIYPNLDWFAAGVLNIMLPVFIYFMYRYDYETKKEVIKRTSNGKFAYIVYFSIIFIILFLCTFLLGFYEYKIIAIASNSMNPLFYKADAVVYYEINEKNINMLEKYDIIVYSKDGQNIVHRIVNIINKDGEVYYQTKGDANNAPDSSLVSQKQVLGLYKFHIKYIGQPSIWLSEIINKK